MAEAADFVPVRRHSRAWRRTTPGLGDKELLCLEANEANLPGTDSCLFCTRHGDIKPSRATNGCYWVLLVRTMQIFVAALLALIFATRAIAAPETNAQRLSRGLPPLRPKFGSILPGFSPTRIYGARRNAPSPYPPTPTQQTYTGRIQVRNGEGRSLGYIKNWAGLSTINGINFGGEDEELHVSFTLPAGKNGPFDIFTTNPNFEKPYYAGVSAGSTAASLASGQPNGIAFINVPQTQPGSPPVLVDSAFVESAIWFFDRNTKQITPQYINPDGSRPPTIIAYNIRSNQLFFVGDIGAWNNQHVNTPSSPVTFYLEEL